jgi:dienelactone hydrolase
MRDLVAALALLASPVAGIAQVQQPIPRSAFEVLTTIYQYDRDYPLNAQVVRRDEDSLYKRERLVFRSTRDGWVTAYVAVPRARQGPFPLVLLLHSLTGSKEDWWQMGNFTSGGDVTYALLRAGYAVAMLDIQYHGDRRAYNGFEEPGPMVFEHDWSNRYREMIVQSVIDYRSLLDVLGKRTDIDSTRVGALGYSLGGMMTFILTAVDARIKVAAVASSPPRQHNPLRAAVAPQNFAPAINCPFLMLAGSRDGSNMVPEATAVFGMIASKTKDLRFFDSEHQLPRAYVDVALQWFVRYLPPSPTPRVPPN